MAALKWLELSTPVHYEDFLSAVILSVSYISGIELDHETYPECYKLLDDFLIPLSSDINQLNYKGYKLKLDERLFSSLRECISWVSFKKREVHAYQSRGMMLPPGIWEFTEREVIMAKLYADTVLDIANEKYLDAYSLPRTFRRPFITWDFTLNEDEYFDWYGFYLDLLTPRAESIKASVMKNEINKINNRISNNMMRVLVKATSLYTGGDKNATEFVLAELDTSRLSIKEIAGDEILSSSLNKIRDIDKAIKSKKLPAKAGTTILHGLDIPLLFGQEFRFTIDIHSLKDDFKYLIFDKFLSINSYIRVLSVILEKLGDNGQYDKLHAIYKHMQVLTHTIESFPTSSMNLSLQNYIDTNVVIPRVYVNPRDWGLKK